MASLRIAHLYPEVLNLYGDKGNILCMERRLSWRGIACTTDLLPLDGEKKLAPYDLIFIGGGQDFDQRVVLDDLASGTAEELRAATADGTTFLCICGGFQLMGNGYETADGRKWDFVGAVDCYTKGSPERMIGNYAFRLGEESGGSDVVGFENHSGRTHLGSGVKPLGTILRGNGNNGEDGTEGLRSNNVFCTYCHGPALPKNPAFCDLLLKTALERKYGSFTLDPLDDSDEDRAHDTMLSRVLAGTAEKDQ